MLPPSWCRLSGGSSRPRGGLPRQERHRALQMVDTPPARSLQDGESVSAVCRASEVVCQGLPPCFAVPPQPLCFAFLPQGWPSPYQSLSAAVAAYCAPDNGCRHYLSLTSSVARSRRRLAVSWQSTEGRRCRWVAACMPSRISVCCGCHARVCPHTAFREPRRCRCRECPCRSLRRWFAPPRPAILSVETWHVASLRSPLYPAIPQPPCPAVP